MKSLKYLFLCAFLCIFCVHCNSQQQQMVSGTIVDENGKAMQGVALTIKGTDLQTITDANGNFQITTEFKSTLIVSAPSLEGEEIKIKDNMLNLMITEDGLRTRYWCCTSHDEVPHCNLKKAVLKETHNDEEEYTRY